MVAPVSAPGPVAGLPALNPAPVSPAGSAERLANSGPGLQHTAAPQRATPHDEPPLASRRLNADPVGPTSLESHPDREPHRPSTTFLTQAISQELDAESGSPSGGNRDPRSVAGLYSRTGDAVARSLFRALAPPPDFGDPVS